MSDAEQPSAASTRQSKGGRADRPPLPPDAGPLRRLWRMSLWKRACVLASVLLMGAGVALPFLLPELAPAQTQQQAQTQEEAGDLPPGAQGLAPTEPLPDGAAAPDAEDGTSEISPAMFRLGFSFFVGFAIAFAVRSFIRITLAVVGMYLLLTFGLEYAGLLEVRWGAVAERYDSLAAWLDAETESFKAFITGRVPAAAAALAGLGIGFTRK